MDSRLDQAMSELAVRWHVRMLDAGMRDASRRWASPVAFRFFLCSRERLRDEAAVAVDAGELWGSSQRRSRCP